MARIAQKSHGIATRRELLEAGLTRKEIAHKLASGALIRQYRGVYRVGHCAPSTEAGYLAAVRACGEGAMLSGRAAAYLQALLKGAPPPPQVTAPTKRKIAGLRTRRSRRGDQQDRTIWRAIPITAVPRTLVDIATELSEQELARACHEAGVRYGTTPAQVEAVLSRRPNSPGAARLRRVLRGDVKVTLSQLEARFLALLREAGLALPVTNRPPGGRRVDCRWPDIGLTVELDSYRYHNSRYSWEQDRRREREAHARGDELRRYTYGDVFEDPRLMMAELRALAPRASGGRARPRAAARARR